MSKRLFTATSSAQGGRTGTVTLGRDASVLPLRRPHTSESGTDPEELFAAGYAACFASALGGVARAEHADVQAAVITAHVSLHMTDTRDYFLSVVLEGDLPGLSEDTALRLMQAAHAVCPYSNAVRGNVDVQLTLKAATPQES